jgi:hypothetical protein
MCPVPKIPPISSDPCKANPSLGMSLPAGAVSGTDLEAASNPVRILRYCLMGPGTAAIFSTSSAMALIVIAESIANKLPNQKPSWEGHKNYVRKGIILSLKGDICAE